MVNKNSEFLVLGIITCTQQEVTLLSEEFLYTRIAGLTLFPSLLYTLGIMHFTYTRLQAFECHTMYVKAWTLCREEYH